MVYATFRYLCIGIVSITGILLLVLTVLGDPEAVLTRLRASVASNRTLTGSDAGLIAERDQLHRERSSLERQIVGLRLQTAQLQQELEQAQRPAEPIQTNADGTAQT